MKFCPPVVETIVNSVAEVFEHKFDSNVVYMGRIGVVLRDFDDGVYDLWFVHDCCRE